MIDLSPGPALITPNPCGESVSAELVLDSEKKRKRPPEGNLGGRSGWAKVAAFTQPRMARSGHLLYARLMRMR